MTLQSSLPLSAMTREQLLELLADRLETANAAEAEARAANEAVAEVFKHLHAPAPLLDLMEGKR
jgi:hypothetical protein